jgi:hypothetical protein
MTEPIIATGGAMVGWVNASGGLAKLTVSADAIELRVRILGRYTFKPESIVAVKRLVWIPLLARGIRIQHCIESYPEQIIFWSRGDPGALLDQIQASGFEPKGDAAALPVRRGIAIRWHAIVVSLVVWNGLFQLGERYATPGFAPGAIAFPLFALALLFAVAFTTPRNKVLQRMIINRDRNVGEVRPLFNLLTLISGVILAVLGSIVVILQLR